MLPDATVCVARSEAEDYRPIAPRLLVHDDLDALVHIWNWLQDTVQEDCLICVDDDLRCVRRLIGRPRKVTDPEVIRAIIENSVQIAADLDISTICWSRTANTLLLDPESRPIRFVQPISASFGLRGRARERRFDPCFIGRADADYTMRTLLEDRITYADVRWYWDHGRVFSGRGGNVGLGTDCTAS